MSTPTPRRVAVVGSGVAGLTAAYVASAHAEVTLFEADSRLGGHADTHLVRDGGRTLAIDTGFIVHNRRTYPHLLRLFAELNVPTQESEMSMSVRSDSDGLEYAGALGPVGLFPSWRNAVRPSYLRMLGEIPRFHRAARRLLDEPDSRYTTLAEFADGQGFSPFFRRHFLTPLVAAVWSCDPDLALEYPARYLFEFLSHHGMLQVFGSPRWRTVCGGSHTYVSRVGRMVEARGGTVLLDTKVTSVLETSDGVEVTDGNGLVRAFDAVVLAAHPAQSLGMLAEPTPTQRELLGALPYSQNTAQLHTDDSVLPRLPRARASWNHLERPGTGAVTVTYDLTRLMRLRTSTRYLVTLGGTDLVDQERVIATMDYEHPLYTPASVAARDRAHELDTDRVVFAGAWQGWGFHEDGARSGAQAAARLGFTWMDPEGDHDPGPRLYRTTIQHTRRTPLRKRFRSRGYSWVVDIDALPRRGFEARDHLGAPDRTIRENVEAFLLSEGVDLQGGRILMAANARALGHCFNPITVFWCRHRDGSPAATVVEVHNTYGDRHAYLVHPDADGKARVPKAMYVSPFNDVEGVYDLVVPEPGERLVVAVRLTTPDGAAFDASIRGDRVRSRRGRAALSSWRTTLLIRWHGIALWLRRLPVRPRPPHHQEGVR